MFLILSLITKRISSKIDDLIIMGDFTVSLRAHLNEQPSVSTAPFDIMNYSTFEAFDS